MFSRCFNLQRIGDPRCKKFIEHCEIFSGDDIFTRNTLAASDKSWPAKEEGTIKDNAVIE